MKHYKGIYGENKKISNKEETVNMVDLDSQIHKCDTDEQMRELKFLANKVETLIIMLDKSRIREYMMITESPRRLITINFLSGLGKGFGQAIGFTLLAAIAFYIISQWVDLPIIGKYIAEIINIVEQIRGK